MNSIISQLMKFETAHWWYLWTIFKKKRKRFWCSIIATRLIEIMENVNTLLQTA